MTRLAPTIVLISDYANRRFVALAEWSPADCSVLSVRSDREQALTDAGKAAVQWQTGPVVEREFESARLKSILPQNGPDQDASKYRGSR